MTLEPPTWKFTSGNPAAVAMFGTRDAEHFVSLGPWELSPEQQPDGRASGEKAKEMIETAMRDGSHLFEWTHRRFNGESFPATVLLSRMETDGKAFLQATVRDITEAKRAQTQIKSLHRRNEVILDSAGEGIYGLDLEGNTTFVNPAALKLLGYTQEELIGKPQHALIHHTRPDGRLYPREECPIYAAFTDGRTHHVTDEVFWRKDGTSFPVEYFSNPMHDERGALIGAVVTFNDVTEQKQAEERLSQERKLSAAILNHMPGLSYLITQEGWFLRWNHQFETISGYSAEEIARMHPLDFFPDDQKELVAAQIGQVFMTGCGEIVADFLTKQGKRLPFHFTGGVVTVDNVRCLAGTAQDITERKRVEETLQKTERQLAHAMSLAQLVAWDFDVASGLFTFSDRYYALHGTTAELECGYQMSAEAFARKYVYPADAHHIAEEIAKAVATADPDYHTQLEARILRWNGELRYVLVYITITKDAAGKTIRLHGANQDITERKLAEEKVRQLSQAVEQSPSSVVVTDTDGNIEYVNPKFTALTGYTFAEALGKNPRILKSGEISPEAYRELWQTITAGQEWRGAFHNKKKSGELYWEAASISPIRDAAGRTTHYLAVKEDITERKQAEAAMQAKNAELERFTYAVSHDLRSPLVTIQTFLGYLEQDMTTADAGRIAKDVNFIHTAANKMEALLKELGELSRVGRQINTPEDVSLPVIVNEALAVVAGRISQRGVQVVVAETPAVLHGDRARLAAVFQNLLDNACKFMGDQKEPRIEIGVETHGTEPVFFVRDNGSGIEPGQQEKLFGLFVRLNPQVEGTGIGLALVKRIIEVHGGRIWVESKGAGQGACFYFTLPGAVKKTNEGEKS